MRVPCVCALALVVVGCGDTKGRYAVIKDDAAAKTWEVWRDPSGKELYFRSSLELPHLGIATCADGREVMRIVGATLQTSVYSHLRTPGPPRRFVSPEAVWRDTEARLYFSRREVERALGSAEPRSKPPWVGDFERNCYGGDDAP